MSLGLRRIVTPSILMISLTCLTASDCRAMLTATFVQESVTAQQFGAVGGDRLDDTEAVQRAVYWAIANRATLKLHGQLDVSKTIRIEHPNRGKAIADQVEIDMGINTSLGSGNCLNWTGANNQPIVECHVLQRSMIRLSLVNKTASGVTGFLWHNPDGRLTTNNLNEISISVTGCDLGVQLGDYERDQYNSNIDDNAFPYLYFYRCRNCLLIDSKAQDNNIINHFHAGGATGTERDRDFVIRVKRNGNGLKVNSGFARTDNLKRDNAVIDIRSGSFSCNSFSLEGKDRDLLPLRLGAHVTRGQSCINNFYTTVPIKDSKGRAVVCDNRSGAKFSGCSFGGDLVASQPITSIATVFADGHGVVLKGAGATAVEWTQGTRSGGGKGFTAAHSVVKATGFAGRSLKVKTERVFPVTSRFSVFIKNLTEPITTVGKPPPIIHDKDIGREITFIFAADEQNRAVKWHSTFELSDGSAQTIVPANRKRVYKFICDGSAWVELSRSGQAPGNLLPQPH